MTGGQKEKKQEKKLKTFIHLSVHERNYFIKNNLFAKTFHPFSCTSNFFSAKRLKYFSLFCMI